MTARVSVSLVAALTLAACQSSVQTRAAPINTRASFRGFADSLVLQPSFSNAHWGVLIVDPLTGDTLYSRNAGKLFMPASNQKILTGATALAQLGPHFRFVTQFAGTGPVRDGTLDGDLVVIGRGDPTFSDAMRGDWRSAFRAMADSLSAHGVRRISGAIRRGDDAFPDDIFGFGWQMADATESYGAGVDELFVNEGFERHVTRRANGDSTVTEVVIKDPSLFFLTALRDALAERGISTGAVDAAVPVPAAGLQTVFALQSDTLGAVLARMLKPSQNQIAEILFKTVALEKTGVGTADSARRVLERQMAAWGIGSTGYAIRDGSGLSRHDYVTPETIVRVLDVMRQHRDFAVFYNGLPIAGVDGTIESRMRGTAAERNVHAKTGTVDKARSLSGYVTTADGRVLLFSLLCNNFSVSNRDVERVQDALLVRLATLPYPRTNR
ncbi:MAG: D-alanyl-D-alanine carboxypeptidase/D-alanyl-D-alanine-endopeptidase [Gemmatimonadetes bacterium]|nr:D-alanyl-D-alanine carboxypeptidase/D-alanyl-D-alanine-endopeptidase [Gemmatimonadota bacterium]